MDFYRYAQLNCSLNYYFTGLKMLYCDKIWVLRNLFYSRQITNGKTVAFLAHEDGSDAFISLRDDVSCPVVPCKPYEFASPKCMAAINARPMTLRIEEEFKDEFDAITAGDVIDLAGEISAAAVGGVKRVPSTRAAGSASKKAKFGGEQAGAPGDDGSVVAMLRKDLEKVC